MGRGARIIRIGSQGGMAVLDDVGSAHEVGTGEGSRREDQPAELLVPVEVGDHTVYLRVHDLDPVRTATDAGDVWADEEQEISARGPRLEPVLDGLAAFAGEIAGRLRDTQASRITVQFGCEVAVESGTFLAVIGKASSKSTITVGLEWTP